MCRIMAMIISELQFHKKSLDHIILHTMHLPYYAVVSEPKGEAEGIYKLLTVVVAS